MLSSAGKKKWRMRVQDAVMLAHLIELALDLDQVITAREPSG